STGVDPELTIHVQRIGPITHQPAGFDKLARGIGCWNPIMRRECRKLNSSSVEESIRGDKQGVSMTECNSGEGRLDLAASTGLVDLNLKPDCAGGFWHIS